MLLTTKTGVKLQSEKRLPPRLLQKLTPDEYLRHVDCRPCLPPKKKNQNFMAPEKRSVEVYALRERARPARLREASSDPKRALVERERPD
jgi:hypothetical protein